MTMTNKQLAVLSFIDRYIRDHRGVSPSFDEIAGTIGGDSGSVSRMIGRLEKRGFIRRLPRQARSIEVIKLPHGHGGEK